MPSIECSLQMNVRLSELVTDLAAIA
jgi:hypothetical protein